MQSSSWRLPCLQVLFEEMEVILRVIIDGLKRMLFDVNDGQ